MTQQKQKKVDPAVAFGQAVRARVHASGAKIEDPRDLIAAAEAIRSLVAQLDRTIARAETHEEVPTLIEALRFQGRRAVKHVPGLLAAAKGTAELLRDPQWREAQIGNQAELVAMYADELETARTAALATKEAIARAEDYVKRQSKSADSAEEAWAVATVDLERLAEEADAESRRCRTWYDAAIAAAAARDAGKLEQLRRSVPASAALDAIGKLPRDRPFAAFEREFAVAKLPDIQQAEIRRDMKRLQPVFVRAQGLVTACRMMARQVEGLRIEPANARKALGVLGLPPGALGRLQAALDAPVKERLKALEALARQWKLALDAKQMSAQLQKAGVL